jgi:retinol dehydrogenase 12
VSSREVDGLAVVTGANTGIGKEIAIGLTAAGASVVLACRDLRRAEQARLELRTRTGADARIAPLDLASMVSIRAFVDAFGDIGGRLDILVNNAAFADWGHRRRTTDDGFERTFGVNHLGHFLLTNLLRDRLIRGEPSRVVTMTSELGYRLAKDGLDWSDLQSEQSYDGTLAYARSKLANIYFTQELARRLDGTGVVVNAVSPGYVTSELGHARSADDDVLPARGAARPTTPPVVDVSRLPAPVTAEEGARTAIFMATSPAVAAVTGMCFRDEEPMALRGVANDAAAARRLWEVSCSLVGIADA